MVKSCSLANRSHWWWFLLCFTFIFPVLAYSSGEGGQHSSFPTPVAQYADQAQEMMPVGERIAQRAKSDTFNVVATSIFILAILHTFCAVFFQKWAKRAEAEHHRHFGEAHPEKVCFKATVLEFLGEVEAVFILWAIPLLLYAVYHFGWDQVRLFVYRDADFTEPMFVVIIMAMAATRPIIYLAERALERIARLGGGTPVAWWGTVLVLAPLLGSVITEPGAMTIAALLLGRKFYHLEVSTRLKYATLGLLFVNVSIGGVLTNFAAPPVIMVASRWNWSSSHMFLHYGLKAMVAVVLNVLLYFLWFRKELAQIRPRSLSSENQTTTGMPFWVMLVHVLAMAWTAAVSHSPVLFIGGFLIFLAFCKATAHHQEKLQLRGPVMVGVFLAGLVIHGKMQGWWLEPILRSGLHPWGLHLGSAILTSFNDNALITYLASQVSNLPNRDLARYAIMSGAVAGGGLTVIANAPNPAGQSLLKTFFPDKSISPLGLFLAAFLPTVVAVLCFMLLPR